MKTTFLSVTLLIGAFLFSTMITFASDNDPEKVEKKIIKIIKTDDKGTMMIDSTITTENGKTVVRVDTSSFGMHERMDGPMHHMRENRMMSGREDSGEKYSIEMQSDGDSNRVMVNGEPLPEFFGDPAEMMSGFDSAPCHKMMMRMNDENEMPEPPTPPVPPCRFSGKGQQGMQPQDRQQSGMQPQQGMIDLNDPSIISFEKKVQKDGTEKITIVRKMQ